MTNGLVILSTARDSLYACESIRSNMECCVDYGNPWDLKDDRLVIDVLNTCYDFIAVSLSLCNVETSNFWALRLAESVHRLASQTRIILVSGTSVKPLTLGNLFDYFSGPWVASEDIEEALKKPLRRMKNPNEITCAIKDILDEAHCFKIECSSGAHGPGQTFRKATIEDYLRRTFPDERLREVARRNTVSDSVTINIGNIEKFDGILGQAHDHATGVKITLTSSEIENLQQLADQMRRYADLMGLDGKKTELVKINAEIIQDQISQNVPEPDRLKAAIETVKNLCENVIGNIVASGVLTMINSIAAKFF